MYSSSIDYTVCSTDPTRYNRINCNLTAPVTKFSAMTVTCLTTNCNIMVLSESDFIEINNAKTYFNTDYSNLNPDTLAVILNDLLEPTITCSTDESRRLMLTSSKQFVLNDLSYNSKLITGFYNTELPITANYDEKIDRYIIKAASVGFMLSTPVLYLISNVGMQSYRNLDRDDLCGAKIVMRVNNSFQDNYPIIINNADFTTELPSNDLSSLEFTLVDAYMHEIKLLSPMYLAINVRGVPDEEIIGEFESVYGTATNQISNNSNSNEQK